MNWINAYYSRNDTDGFLILVIIGAIVSIAILVWIMLQINRQTKGIEEIYKLLYHMQENGTTTPNSEPNANAQRPEYMKWLTEKDVQEKQTQQDRSMTKTEKMVFAILIAAVLIAMAAIYLLFA